MGLQWRQREEETWDQSRNEAIDRRALEIMERRRCDWVEAWRRALAEQRLVDKTSDVDVEGRAPMRHPLGSAGHVTLSEQIGRANSSRSGTVAPGRITRSATLPAAVMRSAESSEIDPEAVELVTRARRGGSPLDDALRSQLEAALSTRLDGVRVHTGDDADAAARSLGARAFALGDDVFFRAGAYDPQARDGQRLIAHEVAHTVQAHSAAAPTGDATTVSQPGDASEREADAFADAFVRGIGVHWKNPAASNAASARLDHTLPAMQPGLSQVRVHTSDEPATAAAQPWARTFAAGDDIHLGAGHYRPDDPFATHLSAHEGAHPMQQRGGAADMQTKLEISRPTNALEQQADPATGAMVRGKPGVVSSRPTKIQREPDPAADVHAVKSKEIEHAEAQETTDWPGVVARQKNRQKDIKYHLTTKLDADARGAMERLHTRWDNTVVVQADFDPVSGVLDDKALRQLITADRADAAKLKAKRFASVVEWTKKLATALSAFLDLRQRIKQEYTEFNRFDDNFLDKDVAAALATVPGDFRPADLKAMLAQETGDFTDTNIAGLEGKSQGIVNKLSPNPNFVGIGQINNDADKDARAMAKKLGITLPAKAAGKDDPRKKTATGIKLAANYVAYIGAQLDKGLPAGRPAGAEMRKLVLAGYNGGPFGLIAAAQEVAGTTPYTWEVISKNKKAMSHFQKPGEVQDYVKRVTERAP